jgi:membrane-associated phospholipid phosphatase
MTQTTPSGIQTANETTAARGENRQAARRRHRVEMLLWWSGFALLMVASVLVHFHPDPWPVDLQTTLFVQHLHLLSWEAFFVTFVNTFNDGLPATLEMVICFIVLLLVRRVRLALFLGGGTGVADGLDGLLSTIVGRPRPNPHLIHVSMPEPFHSFPSGHTEHCMVLYGFLLYLSFSRPVREWRYHWLLLPLQMLAVLTILVVGFARVEAGSHWVTDTLAGYLSGALLLWGLITLYRWLPAFLARHHAYKQQEKAHQRARA